MKRIAAALIALFVMGGTAFAATDPPAAGQPYQQFKTTSRFNHVAVIRPSRWDVLGSNLNSIRRNMFGFLGTTLESMEMQGLEVHYYDTGFFESDQDHREMWTDLGAKYVLAIVLWPTSSAASFARYICADSTNTQLVIVGGEDDGAATNGWGAADTTIRGFIDTKSNYDAVSANNGACLINQATGDTLWSAKFGTGRRTVALPANVSSVVRVLRPATFSGSTYIQNADSVNSNMPGTFSGNAQDSVADKNEYLGSLWKVKYANYSGQGVATWINSIGTSTSCPSCPKEVYFLKVPVISVYTQSYPQLLWALVCRFTTVTSLRFAYGWDDVTDWFTNDGLTRPRWRPTAVDSARVGLGAIGIGWDRVSLEAINPDHAVNYIRGTSPVRYEANWVGPAHTYITGKSWIHHVHDSTNSVQGSNLVGRAGGYSPNNGGTILQGGVNLEKFGHRFASRYNPGAANPGNGIGAGGHFGIVQRLAYSDSIRKAVCPECRRPPYLSFGANQILPVGWKPRPTTSNPLWEVYYSASYECPIDSLMWAFDSMLVGPAAGHDKLFLRIDQLTPRSQTFEWDRDSVAAMSPFHNPNEKLTIPVAGRLVQAVSIGSISLGASTRSSYVADANFRAANLLGLKNPVRRGEQANPQVGETAFNTDVMGVYGGSVGLHDFDPRQATRMIYQHPAQSTDHLTANGDYQVDCFLRTVGPYLSAMNSIAGRRTWICVQPWDIYKK